MTFLFLPIRCGVLLFAATCLLAASAAADSSQDPVIARLENATIRQSDFSLFLQGISGPEERAAMKTNSAAEKEALNAYFDLVVLSAKARRDGIDKNANFQKARELMEMKMLSQMLTAQERERFIKAATPTEQELIDYYNRHTEKFQIEPNFTIRQVLVYVKGNPAFPEKGHEDTVAAGRAKAALARLRAGDSWAVVAKEYSDDNITGARGGLLEDGRFGYFPKEMEAAIKDQEIGKPGEVVKTDFGYHVLQVENRLVEKGRQPFEKVKDIIASEVSNEKMAVAHRDYLEPIRKAVKLEATPLALKDTFVLGPPGIKTNDILATLDGKPITQADFEWFARDAFRMEQREQAFTRPGARIGMVNTYLNMRALEARARQLGLDKSPDYLAISKVEEMRLLADFLQERDRTMPWMLTGSTEEARAAVLKKYMEQIQSEVGFKVSPSRASAE